MRHNQVVIDKGYAGLNPVNFGYEDCEKGYGFGPAVRMYWLLHFVESGFGTFRIGDRSYQLKPGQIFVIPPYVETCYEADREQPWQYTWIGFTADGLLPVALGDVVYCPEALRIFQDMKRCSQYQNGRAAFLSARLWELFSLLLESDKKEPDQVEMALNCIHAEYMNELSVQDLADRVNLERTYFSALFKRKIGVSPGKYLFHYRMNMAAALIANQGKSITTAANSVGYTDICNFSRMFKGHFGASPRAYAQRLQAEKE